MQVEGTFSPSKQSGLKLYSFENEHVTCTISSMMCGLQIQTHKKVNYKSNAENDTFNFSLLQQHNPALGIHEERKMHWESDISSSNLSTVPQCLTLKWHMIGMPLF